MNSYSIRQDGVYTGLWTNYSNGQRTLTLDVRSAGYLIAATAFFITIVGGRAWSIEKFFIHQHLANRERTDGLGTAQRLLVRNAGSEVGTLFDLGSLWWSWRKSLPRARNVKRRTLGLAASPFLNEIIFAAASIFSSFIAGKPYEINDVLMKPKNCGILLPTLALNETGQWQRFTIQTALNNTQAARQYVHSCYNLKSASTACSMFPSRSITYSVSTIDCPFAQGAGETNMCKPNGGKALQLITNSLDTGRIFGINIPAENQIEVTKSLTCAPIDISKFTRTDNAGFENATKYLELGPVPAVGPYTLSYKPQTKLDSVGYQLYSIPSVSGSWQPIDVLKVRNGDVSINILEGNSIHYLEQVKDPWFSASKYNNFTKAYLPDNDLAVVACVDQYQICNPFSGASSTCSILGSANEVLQASLSIGLNKYQAVLAARMLPILGMASLWQSVDFMGPGALLASRNVVGLTSSGLPDHQWQLEVEDWFSTSLATMQAAVIQYVNNLDKAELGDHASVFVPPFQLTGVPEDYFCKAQRVRSTGGYISFSLAGILVIYCVGLAVITLSIIFGPAYGWCKNKFKREMNNLDAVRIADLPFQIMRKQLEALGDSGPWKGRMDDNPVTGGDRIYLLPELQKASNIGLWDYLPTRLETVAIIHTATLVSNYADHERDEDFEGDKREWLPKITINESDFESHSLMDEVSSYHHGSVARAKSDRSSVSAPTE